MDPATMGTLVGVKPPYASKVLATQSANLIAYWPLWELSGTTADNYEGTAERDGTYSASGVTLGQTGIGDGNTVPLFDGTNGYVNCQTASFATAFGQNLGTIVGWTVCEDWVTDFDRLFQIRADGNNFIGVMVGPTDGSLRYQRRAGAVTTQGDYAAGSPATFFHWAITWSQAANALLGYYNGSQVISAAAGTWTGNPVIATFAAGDTTPGSALQGKVGHIAHWNTVLTPTQISDLATL